MAFDISELDPSVVPLARGRHSSRAHFVELYETDDALIESVARYICTGLASGEVVVVVATAQHSESIESALSETGLDIRGACEAGSYVSLDAADTLAQIVAKGGTPSTESFRRVVGDLIATVLESGRTVRVFGEMVALLWAEGRTADALRLEDLWNELSDDYPFRLFCAYPLDGVDRAGPVRMDAVCRRHTHVVTGG